MKAILSLVFFIGATGVVHAAPKADVKPPQMSGYSGRVVVEPEIREARQEFRDLWLDYVFWTRNAVQGIIANDKSSIAESEKNALKTAKLIGAALDKYYGKKMESKISGLLSSHYAAIKSYAEGTAEKNSKKQDEATRQITKLSEEISGNLGDVNLYINEKKLGDELEVLGSFHIEQVQHLVKKEFNEEAKTWYDMKNHIKDLSDTIILKIAKNQPRQFED